MTNGNEPRRQVKEDEKEDQPREDGKEENLHMTKWKKMSNGYLNVDEKRVSKSRHYQRMLLCDTRL